MHTYSPSHTSLNYPTMFFRPPDLLYLLILKYIYFISQIPTYTNKTTFTFNTDDSKSLRNVNDCIVIAKDENYNMIFRSQIHKL